MKKSVNKNLLWSGILALTLPLWSSCAWVGQSDSDCTTRYLVRFIDDKNLSFADAFDSEVEDLTLYAFNEEGTLVWSNSEDGDALHPADSKYTMDISALPPGKYQLVAWGGLEGESSFTVPQMTEGESPIEYLTCRLNLQSRADVSRAVSDTDLKNLFHGMLEITIPDESDTTGDYVYEMQLTRNTKNITVVLQQLGTGELNADDYEFYIAAENSHLNYDNSLLSDEPAFYYEAWETQDLSASYGSGTSSDPIAAISDDDDQVITSGTVTQAEALVARLTTSRLVISDWTETERPMLYVDSKVTGATVLAIPLIDYALMVRSHYKGITDDQDFLDRQHDYNLTFFLSDGKWVNSEVIINSWRVVLVNQDLE